MAACRPTAAAGATSRSCPRPRRGRAAARPKPTRSWRVARPGRLGEDERELPVFVEPAFDRRPAPGQQQRILAAAVELVAVLGVDRLAFGEREALPGNFELEVLRR